MTAFQQKQLVIIACLALITAFRIFIGRDAGEFASCVAIFFCTNWQPSPPKAQ